MATDGATVLGPVVQSESRNTMNRKGLRHPFLKTAFFVFLWNLVAVYGLRNTTKPPFCPPPCQCIWHFKRSTSQYFATVTCKNVDKVPFPLPPLTTYLYMRSYSDSRITYIPENYFAKLNVLRIINLSHHLINNRFYIPPTTWILDLSTNNFSGTTLKGMFANLSNLRTLFLDSNPLNGPLLEGTFVGLRNLRKISLSNNGINEIEKGSFDGLTNVSEINLKDNNLRNLTKGVLKGINGDSEKRLRLDLGHNSISWIEEGFFANVTHLRSIDLSQNKLTKFPDLSHINGSFQKLLLADNKICDISNLKKLRMKTIAELSLSNNNITVIDRETFKSISVIMLLDLSYNKIRQLPDNFLAESSKLSELMLHSNFIENITVNTFAGLKGLHGLYISNNRLWKLPDSMFSQMSLQNLFMYNNKFTRLSGRPFKGLTQSELTLLRIYLFSNEITKMEREVLFDLDNSSKLVLDCKTLQELPHTRQYPKAPRIICAPANIGAIPDQREEVALALRRSGFECKRKAANDFDCKICAVGTRGVGLDDMPNSNACINCPAGGFYQDEMGKTDCKKCDVGTFVLPKKAPATSPTLCRACPQGTQSDTYAGFRACKCLPKFSRKDRFGPCEQCSTKGLDCQNDYAILAPGYFWEWNWGQNGTKSRNDYKMFIENLRDEDEKALSNYGKKYEFGQYGKFSWSLPLPHKCPRKSCLGGLYSNCSEGYTGPLCAICRPYYYQRFSKCLRCPSRLKASLQITGVVILFVLVVLAILIGDRKRAGNGRTLADVIISCFKIIVGFYQVMAGVFSSFSNVEWPTAVVWIGKYLRYIELNLVEVAPLGCLYEKFTMNALHEFIIALSVNILVILVIVVYLLIRVSCIRCSKTLSCREIAEKVREVKKSCYRNMCLFLFASYPITSAKIIQILPANCQRLCFDVKNQYCTLLLRTDYSVTCNTETHYWYWHIAAGFLVYPIGFPILILLLVLFYVHLPNKKAASADQKMTDVTSHGFVFSARRSESHDEPAIKFGLSLFYENYRPQCWYWETVEMVRKVLLTSVLILIGPHSRTQIGIGAIISASFAIFYAYLRPIKNWFENLLQTIALMAIFLNLAVGVMLKISDENISPNVNVKADGIGVSILLIFINSIIIILVTVCCVRVIGLYLMKWYKKPRPSSCGPAQCMRCCLGCCLSLLVPCSFAGSKDKLEFTDEHHNILTEAEEYAKHH